VKRRLVAIGLRAATTDGLIRSTGTSARASVRRGEIALAGALVLVGAGFRLRDAVGHSLWLDEAWVGVAARAASLHQFVLGISVTPVLFLVATRLALGFFGQPEVGARFLPLAFAILTLPLAYRLGRELQGMMGGLLATLLVVAQPEFVDYAKQLKEYSADTAATLAIVWLGLRWLRRPSRANSWALTLVAALAPGFAHPALLVNGALLGALAIAAWQRRSREAWRSLLRVATPIAAASLGFWLFAERYTNPALYQYWAGAFLPLAPAALPLAFSRTLALLSPGPVLARVLAAVALGTAVALAVQRRFAALTLVALLPVEAIVAAMLGRYPFGDARTGSYLTVLLLVAAGAGIGHLAGRLGRQSRPMAGLVVLGLVLWWGAKVPVATLGVFGPREDVGPLIRYQVAHRQPGDLVAVYYASIFAYAYYGDEPYQLVPIAGDTIGFTLDFDRPDVALILPHRGQDAAYDAEVRQIVARAGAGRIWLVLSHIYGDEGTYLPDQFARTDRLVQRWTAPNAELVLLAPPGPAADQPSVGRPPPPIATVHP
jgi:hypothetical protein